MMVLSSQNPQRSNNRQPMTRRLVLKEDGCFLGGKLDCDSSEPGRSSWSCEDSLGKSPLENVTSSGFRRLYETIL